MQILRPEDRLRMTGWGRGRAGGRQAELNRGVLPASADTRFVSAAREGYVELGGAAALEVITLCSQGGH